MKRTIKHIGLLLMATILSFHVWAQDKEIDINLNVNKKNDVWYQQPWVWVAGGAVFILLLVALLRGRGKKE